MNVVIPMAGSGQRFIQAGYTQPKPVIPVWGKPMIKHVIGMFDPADRLVYVCNNRRDQLPDVLGVIGTDSEFVVIPEHKKGPVFTVKAAYSKIPDNEPVMVSYCDNVVNFDRERFLKHVEGWDGCMLTHTGFHPHTLSDTRMAFIRETDGRVLEVQEKASYTDNPQSEHASSGLYWFRTGAILKHYFDRALAENLTYHDEYYVTLVYNLLVRDGLKVCFYDTEQVAILGTPQELENLEAWRCLALNPGIKNGAEAIRCFDYWRTWFARNNVKVS